METVTKQNSSCVQCRVTILPVVCPDGNLLLDLAPKGGGSLMIARENPGSYWQLVPNGLNMYPDVILYSLFNENTGLWMGQTEEENPVLQYTNSVSIVNDNILYCWVVSKRPKGVVFFIPGDNVVLGVTDALCKEGTTVKLYTWDGSAGQYWNLRGELM